MNRVELLRDLYVWAYEHSTQQYLAIKRDMVEPDPLKLVYRDLIKQTIREIVIQPEEDALSIIQRRVGELATAMDQENAKNLIIEELRRLHEGVLARYGLRSSEYLRWKKYLENQGTGRS